MKRLYYFSYVIFVSSCTLAPVVPIYDRQTVMEAESAGEWPNFGKEFLVDSILDGPSALPTIESPRSKRRALNFLQGEFQ